MTSRHLCFSCKLKDICKYRDRIRKLILDENMTKVFAHDITLAVINCNYYIEDEIGDINFDDDESVFTQYEEHTDDEDYNIEWNMPDEDSIFYDYSHGDYDSFIEPNDYDDNASKKLSEYIKNNKTCNMCGKLVTDGIVVMNFNQRLNSQDSAIQFVCKDCYSSLNRDDYIVEEEDDEDDFLPNSNIDHLDLSDIKDHIKKQK